MKRFISWIFIFLFAQASDIPEPISCVERTHFLSILTANIPAPQARTFVLLDDSLVILSQNGTVTLYDVRNHSFPSSLGTLPLHEPVVKIFGDRSHLYLLTQKGEIKIFSNQFHLLGSIKTNFSTIKKIISYNGLIYIADATKGVAAYKVDRSAPLYFFPSTPVDIRIISDRIALLDEKRGLLLLNPSLQPVVDAPLYDYYYAFSSPTKALLGMEVKSFPYYLPPGERPFATLYVIKEHYIHNFLATKSHNQDHLYPIDLHYLEGLYRHATIDPSSGIIYVATSAGIERFETRYGLKSLGSLTISQDPRHLAYEKPYLFILENSRLLITKHYTKNYPDPTCSDLPFHIPQPKNPPPNFLKDLVQTTYSLKGYFYHYGAGAFDWLYISASGSLVAKLEGMEQDGTLRWQILSKYIKEIQIKTDKEHQRAHITFLGIDPEAPSFLLTLNKHTFTPDGYFFHYGNQAFDWLYLANDHSILAKLEGMDEKGFLRWSQIQDNIEFEFDLKQLQLGDTIRQVVIR